MAISRLVALSWRSVGLQPGHGDFKAGWERERIRYKNINTNSKRKSMKIEFQAGS
jgi:hypothetical protein